MKKILVMSDSHGKVNNVMRAVAMAGDIDCIFHLGDFDKDVKGLSKKYKVYAVRGNCDIYSKQAIELIENIEGVKILALHGAKQRVKHNLLALSLYAKEKQVDIALFGHTHIPTEQYAGGVLLYNPGSLSGTYPTYGIITIENGAAKIKTFTLN